MLKSNYELLTDDAICFSYCQKEHHACILALSSVVSYFFLVVVVWIFEIYFEFFFSFFSYNLLFLAYLFFKTHLKIIYRCKFKFVNFLQFNYFRPKLNFLDNRLSPSQKNNPNYPLLSLLLSSSFSLFPLPPTLNQNRGNTLVFFSSACYCCLLQQQLSALRTWIFSSHDFYSSQIYKQPLRSLFCDGGFAFSGNSCCSDI